MNPILVALDTSSRDRALALADEIADWVGGFKVGLELLSMAGPAVIEELAALGKPVMVDAKLHDIPNTVAGAVSGLVGRGGRWLTVHASGGPAMLEAAVQAAGNDMGILAVTVLTSLGRDELDVLGWDSGTTAVELARVAQNAGAEGIVCSPQELVVMSAEMPTLIKVTPGIRNPGDDPGDQRRVAAPGDAMAWGADWLVIGRSITSSADPVAAARRILEDVGRVAT